MASSATRQPSAISEHSRSAGNPVHPGARLHTRGRAPAVGRLSGPLPDLLSAAETNPAGQPAVVQNCLYLLQARAHRSNRKCSRIPWSPVGTLVRRQVSKSSRRKRGSAGISRICAFLVSIHQRQKYATGSGGPRRCGKAWETAGRRARRASGIAGLSLRAGGGSGSRGRPEVHDRGGSRDGGRAGSPPCGRPRGHVLRGCLRSRPRRRR